MDAGHHERQTGQDRLQPADYRKNGVTHRSIKKQNTMFCFFYAFFTNSVRRTIAVLLTRQSISAGSSVRRIFLTVVPLLITSDEPLTLRSLMTVTVSPSFSILPLLSFTSICLIFYVRKIKNISRIKSCFRRLILET